MGRSMERVKVIVTLRTSLASLTARNQKRVAAHQTVAIATMMVEMDRLQLEQISCCQRGILLHRLRSRKIKAPHRTLASLRLSQIAVKARYHSIASLKQESLRSLDRLKSW